MSPDPTARRLLARYGPLAVLALAGVFALVAFAARSSAAGERDDARRTRDALTAMVRIEERAEEIDDVGDDVEMAASRLRGAEEAGPALAGVVDTYQDLLPLGLASLDQRIAAGREIVAIRTQQIDAGARGDHQAFNDLQARYREQAGTWDRTAVGYADLLATLPSINHDDLVGQLPSGAPSPTPPAPASDAVLAPPTGPAVVTSTLPGAIPCDPSGDGCDWEYEVTFTETNGLAVTVQRIGRRYVDLRGSVWASESGEWHDETIEIEPYGTDTYSSWVRDGGGDPPDLDGATLIVSWSGVDADGNPFSGEVRSTLQPRSEVG